MAHFIFFPFFYYWKPHMWSSQEDLIYYKWHWKLFSNSRKHLAVFICENIVNLETSVNLSWQGLVNHICFYISMSLVSISKALYKYNDAVLIQFIYTVTKCLLAVQRLHSNNKIQSKDHKRLKHYLSNRFKASMKGSIQDCYPPSNRHAAPFSTTTSTHISLEGNQQLWMPIMLTSQGYDHLSVSS